MIKAKLWNGEDLKGEWVASFKIDGVRALVLKGGEAMSRNGKRLFGLSQLEPGDYEIFLGSWEDTVSAVRTQDTPPINPVHAYELDPLDNRLFYCIFLDPTAKQLNDHLRNVVAHGYEGLVLRQGNKWLKVKPTENYDVPVIEIQPGTGKHEGRMGALVTPMGKVGTGFTDAQREELSTLPLGTVIEVECMQLTKGGKFRHPRFVRVRYDK